MDWSVIFFLLAILVVGVLIFIAILLTGKRGYHFNIEDYQIRFMRIENKLQKDNPVSFTTTIIEADKLLDKALMEMGVPGKTMGERMKSAGNHFTQNNSVWYAHKMRNQIAHERNFKVDYNKAAHALKAYRQALKDLGAV